MKEMFECSLTKTFTAAGTFEIAEILTPLKWRCGVTLEVYVFALHTVSAVITEADKKIWNTSSISAESSLSVS